MLARQAAWLLVVAAGLSSAALAPARVVIVNAPNVSFDDQQIVIQVRVEPHEENRGLTLAALEGGVVVRSSYEQLDGDKAPRTRWVRWGQLPAGRILLVAALSASNKEIARATRQIRVLSRRGDNADDLEDPFDP